MNLYDLSNDPAVHEMCMACLAHARENPKNAGEGVRTLVIQLVEKYPDLDTVYHVNFLVAAVQHWTDTLKDYYPVREEGHCEFAFQFEQDDPRATEPAFMWAVRVMTARHNDDIDMFQDLVSTILDEGVDELLQGVCAVLFTVACFHHTGGLLKTTLIPVSEPRPEDFEEKR